MKEGYTTPLVHILSWRSGREMLQMRHLKATGQNLQMVSSWLLALCLPKIAMSPNDRESTAISAKNERFMCS